MNKHKNISFYIYIIVLVLSVTSCKTSKIAKTIEYSDPIKDINVDYVFQKLTENELQYNELAMRFNASISIDGKKNSFKGNIRIKKDSVIWASITPLFGIEIFRAILTPDSVKVLNKLDNTYFMGDYRLINNVFQAPFDYDMIQSLLTGNDLSSYDKEQFHLDFNDKQYKLSTAARKKLKKEIKKQEDIDRIIMQDMWIEAESFKIIKQQWKEAQKSYSTLNINYFDFEVIDENMLFSSKLICNISSEVELEIKYDKIQINKPFNYPFAIPSTYKPMIIH